MGKETGIVSFDIELVTSATRLLLLPFAAAALLLKTMKIELLLEMF